MPHNCAIFFGSSINLAMAITAMVFMGILLNHNTGKDLDELERLTMTIDDNITMAANGVADAVQCQDALVVKNASLTNCTDVGFAECEVLTDNFLASNNNLTVLTVQSLNETLNRVVESCENQTSALRAR